METMGAIYGLLFLIIAVLAYLGTPALIIFLIVSGFKNRSKGKCFFHDLRKQLVIMAGAHWYFQCPCGVREAKKIRKGYSPLNQSWLDGNSWNTSQFPSPPTKTFQILRFLGRPIEIKRYDNWPYESKNQSFIPLSAAIAQTNPSFKDNPASD